MGTLTLAAAFGFMLGMRHATDTDHVVAVSTIVSRTRRLGASMALGALWGLGHMLTIFAVGTAIIVFKVAIPARAGMAMEMAVGVMLIALGAFNLSGLRRRFGWGDRHTHEHGHEGPHGHHFPESAEERHEHAHPHAPELGIGALAFARAFGVGVVHGLAGSAAVGLLALATIPTVAGGLIYLAVFGFGTLCGMMLLSLMMETSMLLLVRRFPIDRWLVSGTGVFSVLFGLYVVYHIGFVDGLFLGN